MLLRNLFEAVNYVADAAFAFGRFNPAHQGHIEVYKAVQQAGKKWYIGTNPGTHGPNDPLTFDEKAAWMEAIYPPIKGHILPEQSVVTLASKLYEILGDGKTIAYVTDSNDWAWAGKLLNDYNGKEGAHGYYNFRKILHVESPRVSSATALRTAARSNDEAAFYAASGTDPKLTVNGKTYFDTVVAAVGANPEKVKKVAKKKEPVKELFQPGKDWKWSFKGSEEAVAVFHVGDIPYQFHAYTFSEDPTIWEVEFKNASRNAEQGRTTKFGLTGTGNSAEVMSTIVDIMREFLQRYQGSIKELIFTADESSRQALYARMAKRLLPTWTLTQDGKEFKLSAPTEQGVAEGSIGDKIKGAAKSVKRATQGWGVGAAPDMVTPKGVVQAFGKMDGQRLANFVASRKDLSKPRNNSARAFADKVIDREMRQRGYGRAAGKDEQGVAEGLEDKVVFQGHTIGHIETDSDGDPVGIVYSNNPQSKRPFEIFGYEDVNQLKREMISQWNKRVPKGVAEGAPIVVAQAPIDVRNPKKALQPYRNQGDIVPNTKPPSTEKRGVKGRPGQRPMPKHESAAMAQTAKRLTDPKDGAVAKLRAAGDKRREDQLKGRDIAKRNESADLKASLQELSSELLGKYKKAAGADASKADKEGDFKRGDKRFKGINKATMKQFDNDSKGKK